MDLETLKSVLLWVTLMNWALLLYWGLIFIFARNFIYRLHTRWFRISEQQFDAIHYTGMALYKLAIVLFAFTPWLALVIAA